MASGRTMLGWDLGDVDAGVDAADAAVLGALASVLMDVEVVVGVLVELKVVEAPVVEAPVAEELAVEELAVEVDKATQRSTVAYADVLPTSSQSFSSLRRLCTRNTNHSK
jgi:hypothetical protein